MDCLLKQVLKMGRLLLQKSHKLGLKKHVYPKSLDSQKISEKYLKNLRNKKIFPNLKPGDCIIHHCEVIMEVKIIVKF